MRHGGQIVAKALKLEGVTHVFTLCGGHVQMIYEGCLDEGIRVVDVRHEQTAGHAADGYARLTGMPGVAIVTAGPGVTDVVTAVANAWRAEVPMVVIGGQGARYQGIFGGQDRGGLQEMDGVSLLKPITKWSVSVPEVRRLGEYVQSAFRVALSGVPGPVFLEAPIDVLMMTCDESEVIEYRGSRTRAVPMGDPEFVERAAKALRDAVRPVCIVGSQYHFSPQKDALHTLLETFPIPTFLNGMGRGSHTCTFKRSRSRALSQSDCVLIFGTPLDFRLGYGAKIPENATLIQVDLNGAEIGRNRKVDVGIVGDSGRVMLQLADLLRQHGYTDSMKDWMKVVVALENELFEQNRSEMESSGLPINPQRVCSELNKFVDEKTIVVGDGGDFVATAAYILDVNGPGHWMDPGPLGTLGVGPGYAMAAKLLRPDHRVILVMGDGSFGFNGMEFESMVRQRIQVVGVVGNDAAWTQIRRGQIMMYGEARAVATQLDYTRYDKIVEGMGGYGEYVERPEDLRPAFERAFAQDKPALVNVKIGASDFRKNALAV